jgi:hypothetical protein
MKKYLIVSGDSFVDRKFRSAAHPEMDVSWPMWPELLAEKLDMRLINLGKSGQGNEYIYSALQDTIEEFKDKSQIGMVVVGWSQCFRKDYQDGGGIWCAERVDPHGDVFSWIQKSLRIYKSLEYMCERYNIPYVQTQMIPMYIDWLRGLPPTDQAIMFEGKDMIGDKNEYPGDAVEDEESLLKILIDHDNIINHNNFIGWPISKKLGGYNLSLETIGLQGSPYVISEYDGHPNEEGHKRLAKAIYKHIKEK